jgi:hypothetical protein
MPLSVDELHREALNQTQYINGFSSNIKPEEIATSNSAYSFSDINASKSTYSYLPTIKSASVIATITENSFINGQLVSFDYGPAYDNIMVNQIGAKEKEWEALPMLQRLIKTRDNIERQAMYIGVAVAFGLVISPFLIKTITWNAIIPSVLLSLSLTGFMWIRRQSRR